MILAAHTTRRGTASSLADLGQALRSHLPGRLRRPEPPGVPSIEDAVVRALCHDLRGPVSWLESALGHLRAEGGAPQRELVELAQAQAAHLASMLRTADATAGAPPRRSGARLLRDVVAASVAASGLPRGQLGVRLEGAAADVAVGDARVQRILVNLLENAHRHGGGGPVRLTCRCRPGWVDLALRQDGIRADRVEGHLRTDRPPVDLTGLGLWSVQRQARELGGQVVCTDDGTALTLTVQLPDR
jgi:signal transduction histidine kinase